MPDAANRGVRRQIDATQAQPQPLVSRASAGEALTWQERHRRRMRAAIAAVPRARHWWAPCHRQLQRNLLRALALHASAPDDRLVRVPAGREDTWEDLPPGVYLTGPVGPGTDF
jgi:hypothetical protein